MNNNNHKSSFFHEWYITADNISSVSSVFQFWFACIPLHKRIMDLYFRPKQLKNYTLRHPHIQDVPAHPYSNLLPWSRVVEPKARSAQVRKFNFSDWLSQNLNMYCRHCEACKCLQAILCLFFMQTRHYACNWNMYIFHTFVCFQSAPKVQDISSQWYKAISTKKQCLTTKISHKNDYMAQSHLHITDTCWIILCM